MSKHNPRITINQSGANIGIESVENLNAQQICGSRGSGQTSRGVQPEANTRPRRNIAIGVTVNKDGTKESQTDETARTFGDFVGDLIGAIFDLI